VSRSLAASSPVARRFEHQKSFQRLFVTYTVVDSFTTKPELLSLRHVTQGKDNFTSSLGPLQFVRPVLPFRSSSRPCKYATGVLLGRSNPA
jgi:hypothetical protein